MVYFSLAVLALAASSAAGMPMPMPLTKRIAQVISDSTTKWVAACEAAGGGSQCSTISVTAFSTLLAAPGPCEQQNAADSMIDLAKTLSNPGNMIPLAQVFAQQPRNTPNSQSVPYCQQAPKNAELNGLFQCQFQGASLTTFVGGIPVGQPGTIPFRRTTPVSPPGSCAANPAGPIAAGTQLVDITENPGVGSAGSSASGSGAAAPAPVAASSSAAAPASTAAAKGAASNGSLSSSSTPAPPSSSFALQNGQDAQKLNAQFATLTASSSCTAGENACVGGAFAQCVGSTFVSTPCAGGTTCLALPLVNKPGTSITCTTEADASARIAATGATGGISG